MKEAKEAEVNGVKEAEAMSVNLFLFFSFLYHSVSLSDGPDVANSYWLA